MNNNGECELCGRKNVCLKCGAETNLIDFLRAVLNEYNESKVIDSDGNVRATNAV